ncbi:ADP-ribosylation factor-binding protein GGA2-like [Penaeus chinensis]|uniref:ADP-ribosylation factor-binding protein GGA2-like n=1 Tax=Penaeus chinensis TaxID=139456 RepID=UPI001FB65D10|nr:ADP-ribosylation factor-binding protein GGA2-like [Penaeus chinensis]
MASPAAPSLETLIQKSTNPLNCEDDPNSIQAVCQAVSSEAGGVQTAVRLIAHKIQSPQERESLQALAVLQACVNNCGPSFHAEIGKFRFLNEMIKLVSPKYLGNHTHASVKAKVVELLFTWTIDLKSEPKILEAYNMLKKQGVVKEDPPYMGAPTAPEPRPRTNAVFEDEEKSRLLHRLLQSKNPEDLHKANALIKSMVKEDERRMERTSRRVVEVETALNNVRVLDEMLSRHQESPATQADLDLMQELHSSCSTLRSNIYRLVSEMDDKEEGIGDLLKANDELSRVMGRYKLVVEGTKMETAAPPMPGGKRAKDAPNLKDGEILLDLSTPEDGPSCQGTADILNKDLKDLGLDGLSLGTGAPAVPVVAPTTPPITAGKESSSASLLEDLGGIFSNTPNSSTGVPVGPGSLHTAMAPTLVPQPMTGILGAGDKASSEVPEDRADPLDDLDLLGTTLIKQNLPANVPVQVQFKAQEKLSMNQMKQQQQYAHASPPISTSHPLFPKDSSLPLLGAKSAVLNSSTSSGGENVSDPLAGVDLLSGDIGVGLTPASEPRNSTSSIEKVSLLDDSSLLCAQDDSVVESAVPDKVLPALAKPSNNVKSTINVEAKPRSSAPSKPQFMEVKPMTDLKVSLEDIKPGKQGSVTVLESNDITMTIHFTENQPRDDVSVVVVSTMSRSAQPISNYVLQGVVPKGCKVRLQPPSSTELAAFSPFLPPPAITQIMLIANPNKLNVSLKVMLSYTIDDDPVTEMGEVESLPL